MSVRINPRKLKVLTALSVIGLLLTTCTALPLPSSPPTLEWQWPRDFPKVAQEYDFFNESNGGYHTGMDIKGSGDSVYAAAQGTVVALCPNGEVCLDFSTNADNHNMQGVVILEHTLQDGSVIYSLYAHLKQVNESLEINDVVERGSLLGTTGATLRNGIVVTHVHFEIKDQPVLYNPSGKKLCSYGGYGGYCWGYLPEHPDNHGYHTPIFFLPPLSTSTLAQPSESTVEPPPILQTDRIAFVSNRDGNDEIYVMNTDGSGVTNLTNHPADDYDPAWSPDGTHIAFVSNRDGNPEIYLLNISDQSVTRLTNNYAEDHAPAWSPDGKYIVFSSYQDSLEQPGVGGGQGSDIILKTDIYVMNADGSEMTILSECPGIRCWNYTWSLDGKQITFGAGCWHCGGGMCLHHYTMESDSSQLAELNIPSADITQGAWLIWSPDRTRIAYFYCTHEGCGEVDCSTNLKIYVMNTDGSAESCLTCDDPGGDFEPTWSPDGTRIAFVSNRDGNEEIYIMNADGSNQINLTNNTADDFAPSWSPPTYSSPAPLNPRDAQSIFQWVLYAIENKDISVFENLSSEQWVVYTPISIGEGGKWHTRDEFLADLRLRLNNELQCDGVSYSGDNLTIWTKGWSPEWKMSEFCYQGCQPYNLTSSYAGLSFSKVNEEWGLDYVLLGNYNQDNNVYSVRPFLPCNQSSLTVPTSAIEITNPSPSACPGAPPQRMVISRRGYICASNGVFLRDGTGLSASKITLLKMNTHFTVIGGPSCANDWSWWKIQTDEGSIGWVSEGGDNIDPYYICPVP